MSEEITDTQKNEFVIEALGIAGFTKNPEFPVYTQEHGMKTIVVNLSAEEPSVYFTVDKKKVIIDDEYDTLAKVLDILVKAEGGDLPVKMEADIVVNVKKNETPPGAHEDTHDDSTTPIDTNVGALVPVSTTSDIVRPAVTATQAIAAWNEFQDLKKAILQPSDIQKIQEKDFMKKSAWRKFATFFNLNDKIVEEIQTPHKDGQGWTWKVKIECTAPNGRTTEGVGMCSTSERNFAHIEHDTYATAHTRAKNRAISDMVAAGEVSAEEVST